MLYEKIKVCELQTMTINNITPNYTVEKYDFEIDANNEPIHYAYGVEIIKTAEQVYQGWLQQQNNPSPIPQPSELDLLKEQVINLQAYEIEKIEKQYMEVTNV